MSHIAHWNITPAIKRINVIRDNIDGARGIMLSEVNQTEKKDKYCLHFYVESKR